MLTMSVRMSFNDLKKFYNKVKPHIERISAFDLISHKWFFGENVFEEERAYSLVVLTFKNSHKLRVEIIPQTKPLFKISKKSIRDPHIWKTYLNISFSAEDIDLIEKLSPLLPDYFSLSDLIRLIDSEIAKLEKLKEKLKSAQALQKQ